MGQIKLYWNMNSFVRLHIILFIHVCYLILSLAVGDPWLASPCTCEGWCLEGLQLEERWEPTQIDNQENDSRITWVWPGVYRVDFKPNLGANSRPFDQDSSFPPVTKRCQHLKIWGSQPPRNTSLSHTSQRPEIPPIWSSPFCNTCVKALAQTSFLIPQV